MKLKFSSDGSISELTGWAKQFKEITISTLIEIDLQTQEFICKVSTEDKGLVRHSAISFEKCGLKYESCTNDDGENEVPASRIKAGIFLILQKFITTMEVYNGVEHTMSVEFGYNKDSENYEALRFCFKSKTLKMTVPCQNVSDFKEITDDTFYNRVYVAEDPLTVDVSTENIKNLMGISSIFSTDVNQDIMKFYTRYSDEEQKWAMCVKDKNTSTDYYDYTLGYINEDIPADAAPIELYVFRSKFSMAVAKSPVDVTLKIGKESPNRMLIESTDGMTKTVISTTRC